MIQYKGMVQAKFLSRPNRFIAHCEVDGKEVVAHVKNTGRCRELLIEGVTVYLQHHDNPKRKTAYSLIAVEKKGRLINMDSQIPNQVVLEALRSGKLVLPNMESPLTFIKGEYTHGDSRFDVYVESEKGQKALIEVKGVTLEEDHIVRFPDAPSERAIKHIEGLIQAKEIGYESYIIFVIQLEDVAHFEPNNQTQPAFGEALKKAHEAGVQLLAYDTRVGIDFIELKDRKDIKL